jgi:uncharacterized protein (DUF736 family)
MSEQKKNNTGALFTDEKRTNDKAPHYRGTAVVNGIEMQMSAWVNVAQKTGKKYLSINFETPKQQTQTQQTQTRPQVTKSAADDILDYLNGE